MKIASDMPRIWLQPADEHLNFLESVGTTLRLCLVPEGMWLTPWCVVSIWLADWLGSDNTAANNAMVRDFEFKHDTAPDITEMLIPPFLGLHSESTHPCSWLALLWHSATAVRAQPVGAMGAWPPFWYVNGRQGGALLRNKRGANPNHLLGCLVRLVRARDDNRYGGFSRLILSGFEMVLGGGWNTQCPSAWMKLISGVGPGMWRKIFMSSISNDTSRHSNLTWRACRSEPATANWT